MNIIEIYKKFPTQDDCINNLELVRWNNKPVCPYCKSTKQTSEKSSHRYHCNNCNTSYSVTVGTIFHHTHLDLQRWFLAISLVLNAKKGYSARQLGRDISVTKDTAWRILMQIRKAFIDDSALLEGIVEADETYIGGKNRNRHKDKKVENSQGRSAKDKTPVIGVLERGGKIKAKKAKDTSSKTLTSFIKSNVKEGSTVSTDEWIGYKRISEKFNHLVVTHNSGVYVEGIAHTNTLEGFWSLFKRGIIGQYHQISNKYLDKYVDEFCFRYNNRNNTEIFQLAMIKAVKYMI
jgi:transposase-like protein